MTNKKKTIGLALGGGGAKGFVHIGVIKALERAGIYVDYIAGTSMGAIIGGWYAATKDISGLEKIALGTKRSDLFPMRELMKKEDGSLFRGDSITKLLKEHLGNLKVEDCRIPFTAIATDARTGEEVRISGGPLAGAIRASIALPVVLAPVQLDGRLLTDGGMTNPVPADVVKAMGADYVIAVDVSSHQISGDISETSKGIYSVFTEAISIIEYQIAKPILEKADMVLRPPILHYDWMDFEKSAELIAVGKEETELNIKKILKGAGRRKPQRTFAEKFLDFITNEPD